MMNMAIKKEVIHMQLENTLTASRITIRDYHAADLPFVTAMWFDPENGRYLSDPTTEYVDEVYQAALDKLENSDDGYYLTVVLNGTEEIIGSCFIFPDGQGKCFELAYCIHKAHWRKGYATELLSLVTAWAKDNGFTEITAEAAKENIASDTLLRKNGFTVTGESEFQKYNMDITYESYIYSLKLK